MTDALWLLLAMRPRARRTDDVFLRPVEGLVAAGFDDDHVRVHVLQRGVRHRSEDVQLVLSPLSTGRVEDGLCVGARRKALTYEVAGGRGGGRLGASPGGEAVPHSGASQQVLLWGRAQPSQAEGGAAARPQRALRPKEPTMRKSS